ncbi:Fur family transcriptional regulator [Micromonosporaceae bacterium Da 78-11]
MPGPSNDVDALLTRASAHGLRRTTVCRAVLTALLDQPWLTARQLHERLAAEAVHADLSTAHRVLHRLSRAGMVQAMQCDAGVGYRLADPDEHCLVCQECGRTVPLAAPWVAPLLCGVATSGFEIGAVVLAGRCPPCAALSGPATASVDESARR